MKNGNGSIGIKKAMNCLPIGICPCEAYTDSRNAFLFLFLETNCFFPFDF